MWRKRRGAKNRNGTTSSTANTNTRGSLLKRHRQLVHIPGQRRRQRLGFVVVSAAPSDCARRVVAGQLHHAAEEHQPEDQPAEEPDAHRRGSANSARKPASTSRMSHWNDRKSCPTAHTESHSTRQTASAAAASVRRPPPARARRRRSTPTAERHRWSSATEPSAHPNTPRRRVPRARPADSPRTAESRAIRSAPSPVSQRI